MSPAIDTLSQSPTFVDAMNGMAFLDSDGRFLKANHEFCSTLERNEAELRGLALSGYVEPEDLLAFTSSIEAARISPAVQDEIVCRLRAKSGRLKPAKMSIKRLDGADGGLLCFFSQATEIDPIVPRAAKAQNIEWKPFVRQNWWQILVALGALAGAFMHERDSYRDMQDTVVANRSAIVEMTNSIDRIANHLDIPSNPP